MDNFDLPKLDQDTTMRNFPGYEKKQYYDLSELEKGDHGTQQDYGGGMTETDADTSGHMDGPYTRINQKRGKYGHAPKNKLSATSDMYNTEKSKKIGDPLKGGKKR